jgi:hypothetical protein
MTPVIKKYRTVIKYMQNRFPTWGFHKIMVFLHADAMRLGYENTYEQYLDALIEKEGLEI